MSNVIEWKNLTWPEADAAVKKMPACILPLGAIEAHGPHLTLNVDNDIVEEKCRRICQATGIIKMPLLPFGVVYSLYGYPGSLTVSYNTMTIIVKELISSLHDNGFRVVFIHSHHGGNWSLAKQVARESGDDYPDMKLVVLTELSALRAAQNEFCTSPHEDPSKAHADELETSQALECCPEDVFMERAITDYPEFPLDFGSTQYRWRRFSKFGVMGDARAGTREKGKAFLDAELTPMIKKVKFVIDEYFLAKGDNEEDIQGT
jgi:creatinine amidohydrolase